MKNLIKKCNILLTVDGRLWPQSAISPAEIEILKANKQEIIAIIKAEKAEKEEIAKAETKVYQEKLNGIEGLNEIIKLKAKWEAYRYEFEREMEEGNGIFRGIKPEETIEEVSARYPRARAYRLASNYAMASSYSKKSAGEKAVEKILNNEDYTKAITDMKSEWEAYCKKHIWD